MGSELRMPRSMPGAGARRNAARILLAQKPSAVIPGRQRRQVYAACVNLAACGEPGIHNPRPVFMDSGLAPSARPGMTTDRVGSWQAYLFRLDVGVLGDLGIDLQLGLQIPGPFAGL